MCFFRHMGKISWKDKTSNQAVLTKLNLKRSLMNTIKERKLAYFGHTKRHPSMMRNLLEGKMQGKRPKGRPHAQWADNIKEWTGRSLKECTRLAKNRDAWRSLSRQPLNAVERTQESKVSKYKLSIGIHRDTFQPINACKM